MASVFCCKGKALVVCKFSFRQLLTQGGFHHCSTLAVITGRTACALGNETNSRNIAWPGRVNSSVKFIPNSPFPLSAAEGMIKLHPAPGGTEKKLSERFLLESPCLLVTFLCRREQRVRWLSSQECLSAKTKVLDSALLDNLPLPSGRLSHEPCTHLSQ